MPSDTSIIALMSRLPIELTNHILSYLPAESLYAFGLTCHDAYNILTPSTLHYYQATKPFISHSGVPDQDEEVSAQRFRFLSLLERDTKQHDQYACYFSGRLQHAGTDDTPKIISDMEGPPKSKLGRLIKMKHMDFAFNLAFSDIYRVMQHQRGLLPLPAGMPLTALEIKGRQRRENISSPSQITPLGKLSHTFRVEPHVLRGCLYLHAVHSFTIEAWRHNGGGPAPMTVDFAASIFDRADYSTCRHLDLYRDWRMNNTNNEHYNRSIIRRSFQACTALSRGRSNLDIETPASARIEHWFCGHCETEAIITLHTINRGKVDMVVDVYHRLGTCEDPTTGYFQDLYRSPRRNIRKVELVQIHQLFRGSPGQSTHGNFAITRWATCGRKLVRNDHTVEALDLNIRFAFTRP